MCGYQSSATLTTDRLHYKLQSRLLVREGAPKRWAKQFSGKINSWSWAPMGYPTPRHNDTVSRKATSNVCNSGSCSIGNDTLPRSQRRPSVWCLNIPDRHKTNDCKLNHLNKTIASVDDKLSHCLHQSCSCLGRHFEETLYMPHIHLLRPTRSVIYFIWALLKASDFVTMNCSMTKPEDKMTIFNRTTSS
jgi:hypothetical protein